MPQEAISPFYHQSHKEKSVKDGHRPQRLPLILFFVGYNAGGENGYWSYLPSDRSIYHWVFLCPFLGVDRRKIT